MKCNYVIYHKLNKSGYKNKVQKYFSEQLGWPKNSVGISGADEYKEERGNLLTIYLKICKFSASEETPRGSEFHSMKARVWFEQIELFCMGKAWLCI